VVALIDFQTAKTILKAVGIQVPTDIVDEKGLLAWLEGQEQTINNQVAPLVKRLRIVRAVRDLLITE